MLALLLGLIARQPVRAQTPPAEALTVTEYGARLAAVADELARAAPADQQDTLARARRDLQPIRSVRLSNGEIVQVAPLLDDVVDLGVARARLQAVSQQVALARGDHLAERRATLAAILARGEYSTESLWTRFLRWLEALFNRIFPRGLTPGLDAPVERSAGRALTWLIVAIAVPAIILLLAYWLQRLLRRFAADDASRRPHPGDGDTPQTAAEARRQATAQAGAGSFRAAVRSLYLSALLLLEENSLVSGDRTLTNRELLAQASASGAVRRALTPVVETFDAVWYGVREPDAAHFAAYEAEIETLQRVVADDSAAETKAHP